MAAALASLQGALNLEALIDPRTLWITAQRFAKLSLEAPGRDPLAKAEAGVVTLERCLNEGNVAIFTDIGGSADAYLTWRQSMDPVPAARVLAEFSRPTSHPAEAQRAYTFALEHAQDVPQPSDFGRLLPGMSSESRGGLPQPRGPLGGSAASRSPRWAAHRSGLSSTQARHLPLPSSPARQGWE